MSFNHNAIKANEDMLLYIDSIKDLAIREIYLEEYMAVDCTQSTNWRQEAKNRAVMRVFKLEDAREELAFEYEYRHRMWKCDKIATSAPVVTSEEVVRRDNKAYNAMSKRVHEKYVLNVQGFASRNGKPSAFKRSNIATAAWRSANWLNVKLGQARVELVQPQGGKQVKSSEAASCKQQRQERAAARAAREVTQRMFARLREREASKRLPKGEREQVIKSQRDKRNPAFDVDFESGLLVAAASGLVTAVTGRFLAKTVVNTAEAVKGKFVDAAEHVSGLLGRHHNAFRRTLREFVSRLKAIIGSIRAIINNAFWVVPVVMILYFIVKYKFGMGNPVSALITSALGVVLGHRLWKLIAKFFPGGDEAEHVEPQAGAGGPLPKLLATLTAFSLFKGKVTQRTVTEFTKRISIIDKVSSGFDTFIAWVADATQALVNCVSSVFNGPKIQLFKEQHGPTKQWFRRVDAAAKRHDTGSVELDAAELDALIDLVVEGHKFKDSYRGTEMEKSVSAYLVRATNLLQPHLGAIASRNNFRMEPLFCMMLGDPGIGKTRMAPALCAAVLLMSGLVPKGTPPEKVAAEVWQKGNSEFWNGYSKQKCIVMDDAFQQRADPTDKDSEYMNIIRMVSPWSFPLNFADLASKGRIFFGSKFIFGTTNVRSIYSDAAKVIAEPNAVGRRIQHGYKLTVKAEYRNPNNGRLDDTKYQEQLAECKGKRGVEGYPFHMWEVAKHDFITGVTLTETQPLAEVIAQMAAELRRRTSTQVDAEKSFNDFVNGFEPEAQGFRRVFGAAKKSWEETKPKRPPISYDTYLELLARVDALPSNDPVRLAHNDGLLTTAQMLEHFPEFCPTPAPMDFETLCVRAEKAFDAAVGEIAKMHPLTAIATTVSIGLGAGLIIRGASELLKMMWRFVIGFFRGPKAESESNRPDSVKSKIKVKKMGKTKVKFRTQETAEVKDEGAVPEFQSSEDVAVTNVYANTYKVYIELPDSSVFMVGQIMFLVSNLAVCPLHYNSLIKEMLSERTITEQSKLIFRHATEEKHTFSMSVGFFQSMKRVVCDDHDIQFVSFKDGTVRAHRNIVGSFIKETDLQYLKKFQGRLDICQLDENDKLLPNSLRRVYVSECMYGEDLPVRGYKVARHYYYASPTNKGDCGAPLCLYDSKHFSGRVCAGFHVAGSTRFSVRTGYSTVLTQEMVREAMDQCKTMDDKFEEDLVSRGVGFQAGHKLPFGVQGSFLPLYVLNKPVSICPKTNYYRVQDMVGTVGEYTYSPAELCPVYRNGELIYPMDNAVRPYATPLLIYEQDYLPQVVHTAFVPLVRELRGCSRRIYTFEEAVLGVPEEKFRSIPRGTAAGFPYVYEVSGGKREFFGTDAEYDLSTDRAKELRKRVDYILDQARNNVRLSHVYVDFLKDELRSPAKIEAVATRLISSAPLDYVVAWRRMFGAFSAAVMRNHTKIGMAPGICVYTDWKDLAQQLKLKGPNVFDGDFKAFDSSEQPMIHCLVLDAINRWYNDGEENARIRRVLWMDLIHSRHVGGRGFDQRHIYQWAKSLPSGHPFTTIINSLYSLVMLIAAYVKKTGDLTGFWNHVSAVTYGDDNVANPDESVTPVYNQATVAEVLSSEFGLTYTSGRKDGKLEPYTTIDNVTFLKRAFRREDNEWLCPLELDSFLYTHYWCKNKKLEQQIINDVLENALQELSMHDQQTWDMYGPKLYALLEARGVAPMAACEKRSYLRVIQSRADNWY